VLVLDLMDQDLSFNTTATPPQFEKSEKKLLFFVVCDDVRNGTSRITSIKRIRSIEDITA
jgi:hypothetical protein